MASVLKVVAPWCFVFGGLAAASADDVMSLLPTQAPKFNKKPTAVKPAPVKKDAKREELRIMRGEKPEVPADSDDDFGDASPSRGSGADCRKDAKKEAPKPDARSEEEKLNEDLRKLESDIAKFKAEGRDRKQIETLEKRAASLRERIRNCGKKEVRERKPDRRENSRNVRDTRQEVRDTLRSVQRRQ
jgi:hypothetical protein